MGKRKETILLAAIIVSSVVELSLSILSKRMQLVWDNTTNLCILALEGVFMVAIWVLAAALYKVRKEKDDKK